MLKIVPYTLIPFLLTPFLFTLIILNMYLGWKHRLLLGNKTYLTLALDVILVSWWERFDGQWYYPVPYIILLLVLAVILRKILKKRIAEK